MTSERLDISRLLAADMRPHLDERAMMWLVQKCGGVLLGNGDEWHVRIADARIKAADRGRALNQALDLIAIRPDLWPLPPSAA